MTARRALLGAAAGAAVFRGAPAIAQGDAAHVLRFVPQADVTVLDPLATTSYAVRNHGHLCSDTLYGWMPISGRSRSWRRGMTLPLNVKREA